MRKNPPAASRLSDPNSWLNEHGDYLFAYALRHLRDASLAEETVQETLIAAWQSRESYSGSAAERTWLTGILKHKILDCFRRLRREKAFESLDEKDTDRDDALTDAAFAEDGHWVNAPRDWGDPERVLEQKRFWEALSACLEGLSRQQQAIFALREFSGIETEAICRELGISASNLWVILYRARMALKECLEATWLGETGVSRGPA